REGAAGRVEIAPFRRSILSILTRLSKIPVRCSFFSVRNKAKKKDTPAPPNLAVKGKARRNLLSSDGKDSFIRM
ncbi:hypothetical protein Q6284_33705, partial [Klebsiella pneumoniae]